MDRFGRVTRRVGKHPEVVVERMILLHDDDDVFDLVEVTVRMSDGNHQADQNQAEPAGRKRLVSHGFPSP